VVRRHAEADADAAGEETLAENRFLAARDGMRARLIDDRTGRSRPADDALAELLGECWRQAAALGCTTELGDAVALATNTGDARQRAHAERDGLTELLRRLADEFTARDRSPIPA
jgi:carboxylate-amine ligase